MTASPANLCQYLRHLSDGGLACDSDASLLERFARRHDEEAFRVLLGRHGPMVLRLCRRVLGNEHGAEDVFQAAFLVLARKAAGLRRPERLSAWLHGVAYRLALKARAARTRRLEVERQCSLSSATRAPDPLDAMSGRELLTLVDEELQRLPERFRLPLLLCCLQGRSKPEAARLLGWTVGAVKGRLERGRARLQARLARRGLSLSAAVLVLQMQESAQASLPVALRNATVASAAAMARGELLAGAASPLVVELAERALGSLAAGKGRGVLAVLLVMGMLAVGVGVWAQPRPAERQKASRPPTDRKAEGHRKPPPQSAIQEQGSRRDRYGDPLPNGAIACIGSMRLRHTPMPQYLAFTPDGKSLVSQSQESVLVWDVKTGRQRFQVSQPNANVSSAAVSPDGKLLAIVLAGKLHLWSLRTGKEVPLPIPAGDSLGAVAFVPGGGQLLTEGIAGNEGQLTCWDLQRGTRLYHASQGRVGAISPDGKRIACAGTSLHIWDAAARKDVCTIDAKSAVHALAFCKGGKVLAAGAADGAVALWDSDTGKEIGRLVGHKSAVYSLTVLPDGKTLASGAQDGTIRLWDVERTCEIRRILSHAHNLLALANSSDGSLLAAAGSDGVIRLWDPRTAREHLPYAGPMAAPKWVHFCPDGKTLVTVGGDQIGLWDAHTGAPQALFEEHAAEDGLDLSRDGKKLATVSYREGVAHVYELPSGKELRRLDRANTLGLAFSPDGRALAIDEDRALRLWDLTQRDKKRSLPRAENASGGPLVFSPDGKTLFLSGGPARGHIIRGLDAVTGKERWQAGPLPGTVFSLDVSPDGRLLAAAGDRGMVLLYDTATGKQVRRCNGSPARVLPVVFSPDGRMLASGCLDKSLRLWEVATGQQRRCIADFEAGVSKLSFSPDGRLLASCCSQGSTVLVWGLRKPSPDKASHGRLTSDQLEAYWQDLSGSDAARAYQAILALVAAPSQAVPFLADHLRPVPAADPEHLKGLLERLDSGDFSDRQKATQKLERLGFAAEPCLRKALAAGLGLEARRRIERLLSKLEGLPALQVVRTIEALELADTPEARRLLEALATGADEARPTREARASLRRLQRRMAVSP